MERAEKAHDPKAGCKRNDRRVEAARISSWRDQQHPVITGCSAQFGRLWLDRHFEVVILSSALKIRKPAPEIFRAATGAMNVEPAHCAYLGNRISKDVVDCKRAGFALGIIIEQPGQPRADEQDQVIAPGWSFIRWVNSWTFSRRGVRVSQLGQRRISPRLKNDKRIRSRDLC